MIEIVAFDADDTLWHTEDMFVSVQNQLAEILSHYCDEKTVHDKMHATEKANIGLFGYGIKGFTLSMIETAISLSQGKVDANDIHKIIQLGKKMLDSPMRLMDEVENVLEELKQFYTLAIITKGDLLDQTNKIEKSELSRHFKYLEVVSEKDSSTYENLFQTWGVPAERIMMIGNSLPSDVLPVLKIGAYCVHIPYQETAIHEQTNKVGSGHRFHHLEKISDLPKYLEQISLRDLI